MEKVLLVHRQKRNSLSDAQSAKSLIKGTKKVLRPMIAGEATKQSKQWRPLKFYVVENFSLTVNRLKLRTINGMELNAKVSER